MREPGECIMRRVNHNDGGTDLFIDRADQHIWISDQLLRALHDDEDNPWTHLQMDATLVRDPLCDTVNCCWQQDVGTCFKGAILTIKAHNRTVIYKIGDWVPNVSAWSADIPVWEASWPD